MKVSTRPSASQYYLHITLSHALNHQSINFKMRNPPRPKASHQFQRDARFQICPGILLYLNHSNKIPPLDFDTSVPQNPSIPHHPMLKTLALEHPNQNPSGLLQVFCPASPGSRIRLSISAPVPAACGKDLKRGHGQTKQKVRA